MIQARCINLIALYHADLLAGIWPTASDNCFRFQLSKLLPVRTGKNVRSKIRWVIELDNKNAGILCPLIKAAIGIDIRGLYNQHIRLVRRRNQICDCLRTCIHAPVRITCFPDATESLDLFTDKMVPALSQIEAHCHWNKHNALALKRIFISSRSGITGILRRARKGAHSEHHDRGQGGK